MTAISQQPIHVIGGGIAGLWQAFMLVQAGFSVTLHERAEPEQASSWWAGGMLAPDCEAEMAEPIISQLGRISLNLWTKYFPDFCTLQGSLVIAHARDRADLERFARMTQHHERLDAAGLKALEPDLEGRFAQGLFYAAEGHVEPRKVMRVLRETLQQKGVVFSGEEGGTSHNGLVIDCRGLSARDKLPELRGVKGETITLRSKEVNFIRPIRLLHPRWPLYLVPRPDHTYLIGATSIETENNHVTMRSAMELMNAAYALHPAFAEAKIVELGCGLRPAFPDNKPRISISDNIIRVNGLYRHGFLLAPALAQMVRDYLLENKRDNEVMQWN